MSRFTISQTPVILIGLSLLAVTVYPAFAQDATGAGNRKQTVQQRVNAQKENVENKIANLRVKIASKEAALKARLDAFKDKKKAEIADRVNTNLNKINQNQTAQMQKYLSTMSSILDKLEARVNKPTPDIKNPAAAKTAIASARAAIASASAAVSAQTLTDYTIQVSSEAKIRQDAQVMRDKLHADLLALRKTVIDAKQSVANAIRIAKSGAEVKKEGTRSGQQ